MTQRAGVISRHATLAALAVILLTACGIPLGSSGSSTSIPNIAGSYSGSWTVYGQADSSYIQMQINQSGQSLSGTTTEGSPAVTANDSGTLSPDGSLTITETWQDSSHSYLVGSVAGPGHLAGT